MYWNSLRLLKDVASVAFAVVLAMVILDVLEEQDILTSSFSTLGVVDIFAYSYVAFAAHVAVLFPDKKTDPEINKRIGGFIWRVFLMNLPLFIVAFLIAMFAMSFVETLDVSNLEDVKGYTVMMLLPVSGAIFLLIFSLIGTLLPAFVYGKNKGLGQALGRKKWPIVWRIIVGPGTLNILIILLALAVTSFGLVEGRNFQANWSPNVADIIFSLVLYTVHIWGVVMLAYILSTEYIKAEGIIPGVSDQEIQDAVKLSQMD